MRNHRAYVVRGAVTVALALALVGCGVPSGTQVVPVRPGPEAAPAQGDEAPSAPAGREATTDPAEFTRNFLVASAGSPDQAVNRVRKFLSPQVQDDWSPKPEVNVVRIEGGPTLRAAGLTVDVQVTHLGILGDNGAVDPVAPRAATYTFQLTELERPATGLYVSNPPDVILLPDTALTQYYEPRTLYFWSADGSTLVPDLRWLSLLDVPSAQRPMQIIDWLLEGPSPWLKPTVRALPAEATRVGNVPVSAGQSLEVRLSRAADTNDKAEVDRLAAQLRWSLRGSSGGDSRLVLRIDNARAEYSDQSYLDANPAHRDGGQPARLCVYEGNLRRLLPVRDGQESIPDLPATYNLTVLKAALGHDGDTVVAAIVRPAGGGGQALDVARAAGATFARPRPVRLPGRRLGQPVWLPGGSAVGLVVADGALAAFGSVGGASRAVPGAPSDLTTIAVPPDGRRVAFVSGGRLYVAPLLRNGTAVTVGTARRLPTRLVGLTGVGWSSQERLVVAGTAAGRVQLHELTVDGAVQKPRTGPLGTTPVTHLVAAPDDPSDGSGEGEVLYEIGGIAYELYAQQRRLGAVDVAGAQDGRTAAPGANPTSPLFLE